VLKKIANPFDNVAVMKRTFREVHLLNRLRHDNLINMNDIFISPSEDIYLVTDFMMTDLHQVIRETTLEGQFIQFFTYQILRGLKFIHSAGVIHRDLKPQNLLVNNNCDLKICDFGLAREQDHQMTGYVVTRYYRAPEVMLTWQEYSYAVDMWSAGCIFAEMLRGTPLFPGKNHIDQFTIITQVLGNPPQEVVERVYSRNVKSYI
jgi:p38 MAP kinase